MKCRHCGYRIVKTLIGWVHDYPKPPTWHVARPMAMSDPIEAIERREIEAILDAYERAKPSSTTRKVGAPDE